MTNENIVYIDEPPPRDADCEFMRFRLTYRGPLRPHRVPSPGSPDKMADHVHAIRRQFHPQLKELWRTNRFLRDHTSWPTDWGLPPLPNDGRMPLVELVAQSHQVNGFRFVPLVRGAWHLECILSILFLRRDVPGSGLIHRGDLDNRLKTLIDALRFPDTPQETGGATPRAGEDPFFCLLEKDEYVTGLTVDADQLLEVRQGEDENTVELVISVEIRPYHTDQFNQAFG